MVFAEHLFPLKLISHQNERQQINVYSRFNIVNRASFTQPSESNRYHTRPIQISPVYTPILDTCSEKHRRISLDEMDCSFPSSLRIQYLQCRSINRTDSYSHKNWLPILRSDDTVQYILFTSSFSDPALLQATTNFFIDDVYIVAHSYI